MFPSAALAGNARVKWCSFTSTVWWVPELWQPEPACRDSRPQGTQPDETVWLLKADFFISAMQKLLPSWQDPALTQDFLGCTCKRLPG